MGKGIKSLRLKGMLARLYYVRPEDPLEDYVPQEHNYVPEIIPFNKTIRNLLV